MPRPRKCRRVESLPGTTYFKPAGIPMRMLEDVLLTVDEVEALRLKELEELDQETGAERMGISRPTFQRILASARKKMADAVLNGKAIRIEGGKFAMANSMYRCFNGHEWSVPFEEMTSTPPELCPTCDTPQIEPVMAAGHGRRGRGWHGSR
ncbi:MAG: DUF134 domain-containing protein [Dehalococcoidales bacterium]|nr:DUF134 domain-containing protein [Dehalococcoidales bacterium]